MKPTLFILAAGMGSRYGGLKQLDGIGPHGEVIMDYSIFDAMRAGFGKVVFVIRSSFKEDFEKHFIPRFNGKISYELVTQEIEYIPEGFSYTPERIKPWGTNHAVMMGATVIHEPFAVINADDYYGVDSYQSLANYLKTLDGLSNEYCMVGFQVGNTLSEKGSVARGICSKDNNGNLTSVVERTQVERIDGKVQYKDENDQWIPIADDTPVSMNIWGFTPDYFAYSEEQFKKFLRENGQNPKAEFFIPLAVNNLIQEKAANVKVLKTSSQWFGVTYQEDRPDVVARLQQLHDRGIYPEKLWA